ncbi:MAG: MFS transporter [Anaerolineae bacterium]
MPSRNRLRRFLAKVQFWRGIQFFESPEYLTRVQRKNFARVQFDALGVGLAMAVNPFLAVFLTRLGASNVQVGLLSSIPGFAGLLLAFVMGQFLERRRNIVPWYSAARGIRLAAFALTGILAFLLPREHTVVAILGLWLVASVPMALLSVAFTVTMNAIAGARGRYALMSRRWSIIAIVSAAMTLVVGQMLDRIRFPLNYQLAFVIFGALGAVISYNAARQYQLPPSDPDPVTADGDSLLDQVGSYAKLIAEERSFMKILGKRLVYITGSRIVMPLFALYYVRELNATDASISLITTVQKALLLVGYFLWTRQRETRGSRFVLLSTTFVMSLYPALTAGNRWVGVMVGLAGLAGVFQAGLKLVFFDELMRRIPEDKSATFVSVDKSMVNLLTIVGPIIGTALANYIGLSGALLVGASLRFLGFLLFVFGDEGDRVAEPTTAA